MRFVKDPIERKWNKCIRKLGKCPECLEFNPMLGVDFQGRNKKYWIECQYCHYTTNMTKSIKPAIKEWNETPKKDIPVLKNCVTCTFYDRDNGYCYRSQTLKRIKDINDCNEWIPKECNLAETK